jgi:TetR/AcrR family transcriptional regulator, acrAB operon repressor
MVRRTKEEAWETRNRILDTAEKVFCDKGVSRTTLAEIADAAGLTRGAIYWHFRNKGDLFGAMLDRIALPMEEMVKQAAGAAVADPLQRIKDMCIYVLRRTAEDPQCRRVFEILFHKCEVVEDMAAPLARQLECRARGVAMIERAFANAIRKGQLPAGVNAKRAANGLICYIDGLLYNWLIDSKSFPLAREAECLVDQYLAGLKLDPAATRRPASRRSGRARAARARVAS